jgi:hypothetical protein
MRVSSRALASRPKDVSDNLCVRACVHACGGPTVIGTEHTAEQELPHYIVGVPEGEQHADRIRSINCSSRRIVSGGTSAQLTCDIPPSSLSLTCTARDSHRSPPTAANDKTVKIWSFLEDE